jgi:predicted nucleotidyltransferase
MSELIKVDTDLIVARVCAALKDYPQVAGAYLFGSILELCRPDSDIDLGIVLVAGVKPDSTEGDRLEAAISLRLAPVGGHSFDIVLLNPDKPLFTFKVITEGKLIYIGDNERITDVIEYVSRRYSDLYPRYRRALEEIFAEVMSGGLGP